MHLKNNLFSICIIPVIIFIGCSDDNQTPIISNLPPELPRPIYKLNLQSDSGENLNSVTIIWNDTDGDIIISNNSISPNVNFFTSSDMKPGEFRDISIQVIMDDSTYVDSIQIFTRPIYPVTNLKYKIVTVQSENETKYHRYLSWTPGIETQNNFSNYTIYREEYDNAYLLNDPENCDNCQIMTLSSYIDTSYIDSSVQEVSGEYKFIYQVQVSVNGYTRNSLIYNYNYFNSLSKISLDNSNVSTNNNEFIQITWDPVSTSTYFYQYEIWRAPDEELLDTTLLAIIINPEQGKFMDRNAGNGTTWYYSVAVVDIIENRKFSDFIAGWSKP
jgi:hypothetical protein